MAGVKKQTIPIPPYGPQLTFALISGIMFAMVSVIRNVLFSFRNYLFFFRDLEVFSKVICIFFDLHT